MVDLTKRKYKKREVETLLLQGQDEVNVQLKESLQLIAELKEENRSLSAKILEYQQKESIIVSAIKDSEEKAREIENNSQMRYALAVRSLKVFLNRWNAYFVMLKEKYPMYPAVVKANELFDKLGNLLANGNNKQVIEQLSDEVNKKDYDANVPFNPKKKIEEYVAATSDNGFNLDEVLNPGELRLEDLCKELGLMDEE